MKQVALKDFIQGIFLLDKGLPYTIKELIIRPGHSIRNYVKGKRVLYFNYFSLLIILLSSNIFLSQYKSVSLIEMYGDEVLSGYLKLSKSYGKILKVIGIPLWAVIIYFVFRKAKQNYVENVVLSIYMLCGMLIVNLPFEIFSMFNTQISLLLWVNNIKAILITIYSFYFIYQYFSVFGYKKHSLIIRSLSTVIGIVLVENLITQLVNQVGMIISLGG
ncbi:MAG: DUF3667 domain-containing protein [Tenacibaculum sp.]|nr:DUF3667 domain-containing protein [Tenacibaculum sp.]